MRSTPSSRPAPTDPTELDVLTVAHDGEVVVYVRGEIDLATAPLLSERLAKEIPAVRTRLVVDLYDVPFVDSIGLSIFARVCKQLRHSNTDLVLRYPRRQVAKVLRVSNLDRVITVQG